LKVTLNWIDSDADSFYIYRGTRAYEKTKIAVVPAGIQTYNDSGTVTENTTYHYAIIAKNTCDYSNYTPTRSATPTEADPYIPPVSAGKWMKSKGGISVFSRDGKAVITKSP
jgi:hypothetical protein